LKHVVHRRVHLERAQPSSRKRLGYLEKHKDYVKRAKDFHRKEKVIKKLQQKAYFKNEDEFAQGMISRKVENGRVRKKGVHLSQDQLRLLESQDAAYVGLREQADRKVVERRLQSLQFLDAPKQNKHTIFVDDDDDAAAASASSTAGKRGAGAASGKVDLQRFDVAAHLDTHPALLGRQANRLRKRQLETKALADPSELEASTTQAYKEVLHRQERQKRLRRVREELELRQLLRQKGPRRKVADATEGRPAQYRWNYPRKR